MPKAGKILITTESHEIFIVRANDRSEIKGFCNQCLGETELLTIDEAVAFSGIGTLNLVGRVNEGMVHSLEMAGGHLLICKTSLSSRPEEEKAETKNLVE